VGFYGTEAKRLLESAHLDINNPVFHYEDDEFLGYFKSLYESSKDPKKAELSSLGYLYLILSKLIEQQELDSKNKAYGPDSYVQKAINYIQSNYCNPTISINEISQYLGIDRTQFFRHFKQYTGISPQQFLTNFKMAKACEQIKSTNLPIEEIAHSVGFEHSSYFSKVFKKQLQLSPLEYKRLYQSEME
jgi:AraC-like DNA-binding protein